MLLRGHASISDYKTFSLLALNIFPSVTSSDLREMLFQRLLIVNDVTIYTLRCIYSFLYIPPLCFSSPPFLIVPTFVFLPPYIYSKSLSIFHSSSTHPLIYLSMNSPSPSPSLTTHYASKWSLKPVKGVCGLDSLILILFASLHFTTEKPRTLATSAVDCGIFKDHMPHALHYLCSCCRHFYCTLNQRCNLSLQ